MSPHHLQQLDLYHEALLDTRVAALSPYAWGALSLEVDTRALEAGAFALRGFRGILPSGLVVEFEPGAQEAPRSRPVEAHFPSTRPSLEVFLAVPKERANAGNVAGADGTASARQRFVPSTRKVVDLASGATELDISFAAPQLGFLFGGESRDDYECIQVAELVRGGDGRLGLHPTFVPPLLALSASSFVIEGLRRLLTLSMARQRALAEERRHRDKTTVEYEAQDVTRFLLSNALHTHLPLLKHMVDAGDLTAHQAYLLLLQFGGQLTSFSTHEDPTAFPAYAHANLRDTFEPLFGRLSALIQSTLAGRFVAVALTSREDGMHFGQLGDERTRRDGCRFILAVQSEVPEAQVAQMLPRLAKISSWESVGPLLGAALPGARIDPEFRPPKEIPTRPGTAYFAFHADDPHLRAIRKEGNIAIFLPPPFEPTRVRLELFVILPAGG